MSSRDEFPNAVKVALAKRAGFRCSFPRCAATTTGPSDESSMSVANSGMACHISSAAMGPGARRYNPDMTTAERSEIDNGIWMCYRHGKIIDTDQDRFTPSVLRRWREIAELQAKLRQDLGADVTLDSVGTAGGFLATLDVAMPCIGEENTIVGGAIDDSCIPALWGNDVADAVRDVVIEIARNAFAHSLATSCELKIDKLAVHIIHDGTPFDPWLDLREGNGGGSDTIANFLRVFGEKVFTSTSVLNGRNDVAMALARWLTDSDLGGLTNCVLDYKELKPDQAHNRVRVLGDCRRIFVHIPQFATLSDIYKVKDVLDEVMVSGRVIVFLVAGASQLVRDRLRKCFPNTRIVVR